MNHHQLVGDTADLASRLSVSRRRILASSLMAMVAVPAHAGSTFLPYLKSETLYDSNVFRVADNVPAPLIDGDRRKSDLLFNNAVGIDAATTWKQQRAYVHAEGGRYSYLHLSALDQTVYDYGGGLDWVLLGKVNGSFTGNRASSQGNYADRDTTVLNRTKTQNLGASLNFLLTNDVRYDAAYAYQKIDTPVIGSPNFQLQQDRFTTSLKYVGIKRLSTGLIAEYANGGYTGTVDETKFKQYSGSLTADYAFSDISKGSATIGYTNRESTDSQVSRSGTVSGLTGKLEYQRELTGKTKASARLVRDVYAFDAGDNTAVLTALQLQTLWDATDRIDVVLLYSLQNSKFKQQPSGTVNPLFQDRRDLLHEINLTATYEALRWLTVTPKFAFALRDSTRDLSGYETWQVGVQLQAAWPKAPT